MSEDYQTMEISSAYRVFAASSPHTFLPEAIKTHVEAIWLEEANVNPHLFNGRLLSLLSFDEHSLIGVFVEYKHFLAQLRQPELADVLAITPVCVSAITRKGPNILVGKRSTTVLQYPSCYELVPSGGVDADSMKSEEEVDVAALTLRELREETGIGKEEVISIKPTLLIIDRKDKNIEICMNVEVRDSGFPAALAPNSHEHTDLQWVAHKELPLLIAKQHKSWIPLSLYLIGRYFSR